MNILFVNHFFVGFMVSEIPRVSVFGYLPLQNFNLYYFRLIFKLNILFLVFFKYNFKVLVTISIVNNLGIINVAYLSYYC